MGLFMGLGLIGAAFAIDGVKTHNAQLPYKKFERIDPFNEAKWRQAKKMLDAVSHGSYYGDEEKNVIDLGEMNDIVNLYRGTPYWKDAAERDVSVLACARRGLDFGGSSDLNYKFSCDKTVEPLGVIGPHIYCSYKELTPKQCDLARRIAAYDAKKLNISLVEAANKLFDRIDAEKCTIADIYRKYKSTYSTDFTELKLTYEMPAAAYFEPELDLFYDSVLMALLYVERQLPEEKKRPRRLALHSFPTAMHHIW